MAVLSGRFTGSWRRLVPGQSSDSADVDSISVTIVRKNDEDVEYLYEDVYCSIAVTKYMLYLGFNGVEMNPEHLTFKPFIHFQFTTLHVNEVTPVVTAVVCMLIKF